MKTHTISKNVIFMTLITSSFAEEFGGINFPQGAVSFADEVVSFNPTPGVDPAFLTPLEALGPPDYDTVTDLGSVTLGSGGSITLKFVNNVLTGSNSPAHDLHIFEVGGDVEDTFVEISTNGVTWHSVGKVFGGISSIDIDAFGFTAADSFPFVRLRDDPNEGETTGVSPGADIDGVGAISTTSSNHTPQLLVETAVVVKFQSLPGSSYTIQSSNNMNTWVDAISGIAGDGTVKKFFFEITKPRQFYRIKPLGAP